MASNNRLSSAFLIIWVLMIWNVWQLTEKNHIFERFFRLTEISFFFLPLSAIILTFVLGTKAITSTENAFERAGAMLGATMGGIFAVVLAFIIGLIGGIIMHLIANKYEKKAEVSNIKQPETTANKHGIILSLVGVIALVIVMGTITGMQNISKKIEEKENLQQGGENQTSTQNQTQSDRISLEIIKKGFVEANYESGNYQDKITMDLKFTNKTGKNIKGFEGVLVYFDIFDNQITGNKITYDEGIPAHESKIWKTERDYNQFMDEDIKLKDTDLNNLKYEWKVKTIIYEDDTKETF